MLENCLKVAWSQPSLCMKSQELHQAPRQNAWQFLRTASRPFFGVSPMRGANFGGVCSYLWSSLILNNAKSEQILRNHGGLWRPGSCLNTPHNARFCLRKLTSCLRTLYVACKRQACPKNRPKKIMWVPFLRSFPGDEAHQLFAGGPKWGVLGGGQEVYVEKVYELFFFRKLEKAVAVRNSLLEKFSGKFRRCWKIVDRSSGSAKCYPCQGLGVFRQGKRLLENWPRLRERCWIFSSETATAFLSSSEFFRPWI